MYADSSVELKKKSELSQESAVAACKMYVPYISDITRQIEEVVKIFPMEKELRLIKNRGYFPVPQLAPKECKIETIQDKETLIKEIDEVAVEMLNAIRESEENLYSISLTPGVESLCPHQMIHFSLVVVLTF